VENAIIKEDLEAIESSNLPWEKLAGKTVLISGANGFLATYIVKTLLFLNKKIGNKTKIIGLVRDRKKAKARFANYPGRDDLKLVVCDLTKPISIDQKIDYIIHAASHASPKYYGIDPVGTLLPNTLGTFHLLELARIKNVEAFLFFSSGEVYGDTGERKIPIKEDYFGSVDPALVRSCYAESKRMGEAMCISWHYQYNVPVKIVRPFHTFGPGMKLDDGRVYADFVSDIVHGRNIVIKGNGRGKRAFCYLADATCGFFLVLLKGKIGECYNVGNDKGEISIRGLADLLVSLFPEKKLKVVKKERKKNDSYLKSTVSRVCPDIAKIRTLGWKAKYSLKEGFLRTVRSYEIA